MSAKNGYVCVRYEKIDDNGAVGQTAHDWRVKPPEYIRSDKPISLVYLWRAKASQLVAEERIPNVERQIRGVKSMLGKYIREAQDRYRKSTLRTPQRRTKHFRRGLISFSPEGWENVKDEDRVQYLMDLMTRARRLIEEFTAKYDVQPVYMAIHLDEKTPHVHFLTTATDAVGKSIQPKINRQALRELQDLAGRVYGDMGYDRGQSREVTAAVHKTVREAHRLEQEQLEAESERLKREQERLEIDVERQQRTEDELRREVEKLKAEIKAERKTREELAEMSAKERAQHSRDINALRVQKREAQDELKRILREQDTARMKNIKLLVEAKEREVERRKILDEIKRMGREEVDAEEAVAQLGATFREQALAYELIHQRQFIVYKGDLEEYESDDWAKAYQEARDEAQEFDEDKYSEIWAR